MRTNRRVAEDYFSFDDLNSIMDDLAAKRPCAVAGSVEPMLRPDYRAKKKPRPSRQKHKRRVREAWVE